MTPRERAEAVLAEASAPRRVSYAVTIAELYGADLARDLIAAEDALDASRAEAERLRGALIHARQFVASVSEDRIYGVFHGGDPRDFDPDPECSTEEERAAHKAACEEYARNAVARDADCQPFASEDGKMVGWVTRCGFGLGVNTCRDERAEEVLARCDAALAPATEGT